MDETLVYRKSGAGAAQLASTHGELSPAARRLLIMLDGRRTLAELAELFGPDVVEREIVHLESRGFVREVDPELPLGGPTTILAPSAVGSERVASAAARKLPIFGLSAFAVVAAVCASAYWVGGREAPASANEPSPSALPAPTAATGATITPVAAGPSHPDLPRTEALPAAEATDTVAGAQRTAAAPRKAPAAPAALPFTPHKPEPKADAAKPAMADVSDSRAPARLQATPVPPEAAPSTAAAPTPAAAAPPAPTPAPAAPPLAASEAAAIPVAATASVTAAPSVAEQPPVQIALASPDPTPKAPVQLHARRHEPPQFPARALRTGINEGHVQALIWVSAEGTVEQVDILHADPPKVFDDEVRRALSLWSFDPPGVALKRRVDLNFKP